MTIFGCICAYNEAAIIGEAIQSLWAIGCDRVIVVDGKFEGFDDTPAWASTDGTRDVALENGAEVITSPGRCWRDQVEARNQYLLGTDGDWYAVIDADERSQGKLPDLAGEVNAYRVVIEGPVTGPPIQGTRLYRHRGHMAYVNRHYTFYSDGVIVAAKEPTRDYWIRHIERKDSARQALKDDYYPREWSRERGEDARNPMPIIKHIPKNPLPAARYIGNGAWIPGLPARDLSERDTLVYYDLLIGNLASANPLYELEQPAAAVEPDKPETLGDKPAQTKPRRKGRASVPKGKE